MSNAKNLIPQAHSLTVEEQSKGGKNSGESRRKARTIREILKELLGMNAADYPEFAKMAKKLGVEGSKSVKDTFALMCLLNGAKKGNLDELIKLSRLLGEDFLDDGAMDEAAEFNLSNITPFERVNDAKDFGEAEEVDGGESP